MATRSKKAKTRRTTPPMRSSERLVFAFHEKDSPTGVKRETVRRFAAQMNMSETRFLHLGAVLLIRELNKKRPIDADIDDGRLSDRQIEALRSMHPQDQVATASFLDLLNED